MRGRRHPDEKPRARPSRFSWCAATRRSKRRRERFCHENLTGYKRPKYIEFREDRPKTNVGKILRRRVAGQP